MKKSVWFVALTVWLALITAWAGEPAAADHEAMMAGLMDCAVCKNMAPHMATLMPVMSLEFVEMTNGMAMVHAVSDPSKIAEYHEMSAATAKAGQACMTFSDTEASENLCHFCQSIRSLGKAGATVSHGDTKAGDMLVITSEDPAVQAQIAAFRTQAQEMMGS
jgi:hypothetical protein